MKVNFFLASQRSGKGVCKETEPKEYNLADNNIHPPEEASLIGEQKKNSESLGAKKGSQSQDVGFSPTNICKTCKHPESEHYYQLKHNEYHCGIGNCYCITYTKDTPPTKPESVAKDAFNALDEKQGSFIRDKKAETFIYQLKLSNEFLKGFYFGMLLMVIFSIFMYLFLFLGGHLI